MDFRSILVIAISAPVCLTIVMIGLPRMRGKAKATLGPDGKVALELGQSAEVPERREIDRPEGLSRLASELGPMLVAAIDSHGCRNAALICANAEVSANLIDRSIEVGSHAIEKYKVNGVVESAVKSLKDDRVHLRRAIANPGGV